MINTRTDFLNGLPIQSEQTTFRLTDDEISVILNKEYCHPMENHLTKTCFLLKDPRLSRVKNFLDERMKNYTENVVEIEDKFKLTQSWSTTTKKGEKHHSHNHPNAIFSLVFYVNSESGNLVFNLDSRLREKYDFSFRVKKWNSFNAFSWEYKVQTGNLVIFPAWMYHETKPNTSETDRIIIGANYFVQDIIGTTKGVDKIDIQLGDVDDD